MLPEERSLALGIQSIIIRLVGSIPGPVLFGYVVDRVCLLWEPGCGQLVLHLSKYSKYYF